MTRLSENPFGDQFPITVEPGIAAGTFVVATNRSEATVEHTQGEPVARLEYVDSRVRGIGIGTELTLIAAQEAAARGARELHAGIIDAAEMRIFDRLFGGENLTFVQERPDGIYELPMTTQQAVASIALADAIWQIFRLLRVDPPVDFDPGVETIIDLTNPAVRERVGLPPVN